MRPNWDMEFPEFRYLSLSNGTELYMVPGGQHGCCYCEFVLENGRNTEQKKLTSRMTAQQLLEHNGEFSATQIADFFDYYGASYGLHSDLDFTIFSISCLQKHLSVLLPFVISILAKPKFQKESLVKGKKALLSQLKHQLTEPDYVSYREFSAHIYGQDSVYGYNTTEELIKQIQVDDLVEYHESSYHSQLLKIFFTGEINESMNEEFWSGLTQDLNRSFFIRPKLVEHEILPIAPIRQHIDIVHCDQISLKLGKRLFAKSDSSFLGSYLLNTILGDYFGSRLMKKIREEKGYTYDIHSTLDCQRYDGCWYISAELNASKLKQTISAIHEEFIRLQEEDISEDELTMVKNYLYGHILRLMDGSMQTTLFLKILVTEYGGQSAFQKLNQAISQFCAQDLKTLAKKICVLDECSIFTAGAQLMR